MIISWNKKAIATNTKKQFVDSHQHLKDYADLEKVWEDAQPIKKPEKEVNKKAE